MAASMAPCPLLTNMFWRRLSSLHRLPSPPCPTWPRPAGPRLTWYRPTSLARLLALKAQHPDAKLVVGNTEVRGGALG